jgi:SAM-dependent methyltransferase
MYQYSEKYKFTQTWFDPFISPWTKLLTIHLKSYQINSVLEIGCFEGRSTVFLADNFLQKNTNYDIVDTFKGSASEPGMKKATEKLKEKDFIYENFLHNISFFPQINFNINRGISQEILPNLSQQNKKYDFIYIDASHRSDDTFVDAYYANKMLNPGGLIIFDDFRWKDPTNSHPIVSPEVGINVFFHLYNTEYKIIMKGYQIAAIKIK